MIPCFNYGRFLADAVGSCLTQDAVDVTVIVVDDASTDDSVAVAEQLSDDSRVRLIQNPSNQGPVATFNHGLAQVDSEFVVRLDADDLLTPGSLARSAAVARAFPSVGLVYGHPLHFDGEPPPARQRATQWTVWPGRQWLTTRCRSGTNVITSPEVLLRASVVDQVGGQRDLPHTHDMEMWLRVSLHSDVAFVHGADQAWHREHPASLSRHAESRGGLTILRERRDAFVLCLSGEGLEAARLEQTARRALAQEALERACYEIDRGRFDNVVTTELIRFAEETDRNARDSPAWAKLERRLIAPTAWAKRRPWLQLRPFVRMTNDALRARRWRRTGAYEREKQS